MKQTSGLEYTAGEDLKRGDEGPVKRNYDYSREDG